MNKRKEKPSNESGGKKIPPTATRKTGGPRGGKPVEKPLTREEEEARVREQLRALGYL